MIGSFGTVLAYRYYATPTISLDDLQKMVSRGDFDAAVPQLKRYLRHDSRNARARLILAGALAGQEKHEAARENYRAIPDRSFWGIEARFREGLLELRPFGRAVHAEALWKKCLELDEAADPSTISPMGQAATVELLTLYLFQHRKKDASDVIWRWHRRAASDSRGRAAIALLALEFGPAPGPNDLITELEKWVAADPNDEYSRRALGRAYVELGKNEDAGIAMLEALTRSNPTELGHWTAYLTGLAERGDVEQMRAVIERLAPEADGDIDCWQLRGMMHEMAQQWPDAARCFAKALEFDPSRRELHAHLGYVLRRNGDVEDATKYERSASELGDVEEQLHVAYEQLTITQSRPEAESAYMLGDLYEKRDRLREARAWYEEALRLRPNHAQAGEAIDRVRAATASR
jgi:tetratricopeptide (TPR) repeat protein